MIFHVKIVSHKYGKRKGKKQTHSILMINCFMYSNLEKNIVFGLRNLKINAQLGIQENRYGILVQSICAIDIFLRLKNLGRKRFSLVNAQIRKSNFCKCPLSMMLPNRKVNLPKSLSYFCNFLSFLVIRSTCSIKFSFILY